MLNIRAYTAFLCVVCFSSSATLTEKDLLQYDTEIFHNPAFAYEELLTLSSNNKLNNNGKIWLLLRIAQAEESLMLYQNMAKTLNSLDVFSDILNTSQQAQLHYLQGISAHQNGDITASIKELELAIAVIGEQPITAIYVLAVRELGYVYALSGNYYDATYTLQEAYKKVIHLNNGFYNGLLEESLGDTYSYLGSYQKSIEYYTGALSFFEDLAYQPYIASTLLGLAIVNRRLENWDIALAMFGRYESSLQFLNDYSEKFYLYYGKAMTLAEKGDCHVAIEAIDYALALNGPADYDAELYKKRALCNVNQNDIVSAQADLTKAKAIFANFEELHGTQWFIELEYIEGLILYEEHKFDLAYQTIHHYYQSYLVLQRQNNSEHMARIQSTLEAERKDKKIALLTQQSQLQDAKSREQSLIVKQQNMQLSGIIVVLTLLFVFVIFQYRHSRKLLALSIRDELTGLHNRRYFFDFFDEYKTKDHPNQLPGLALLSFDIDNFKQINDNWGHQTGDLVISTVATIANNTLRSNDIIARIGGDEFIVALPRTSLHQAEEIAHRILNNINTYIFTLKSGCQFSITVSLGVSYYEQTQDSQCNLEALIEAADDALYQSKRAGKNCCTVAV